MNDKSREPNNESPSGDIALAAPSWILLVLLALLPPAFATGFSNYEFLKETLLVGGVGLALMVWGVLAVRARALSMIAGRVVTLALVFAAYALVATLWADNQLLGLWESLHFVAIASVVLLISSPVGRPLRFFDFALATGVGAGLAGAMGILDLAGLGVFTVVWDPPGATGAFDAMEFAVAYYVVALPMLLAATFRFSGIWRAVFGVCFALAGFHFGVTAGWWMAGAFAAVCAVSALVIIGYQRAVATSVLIPVGVLLGVVAVFVAFGQWGLAPPAATSDATDLPRLDRAEISTGERLKYDAVRDSLFAADRTETVTSSLAHSYLFEVGRSLFAGRPVVGHGAGSWYPLQTKQVHIDHPFVAGMFHHYPAFRSPHNGVTKLLVEYGAVGLALFVLWLVGILGIALGALGGRTELREWILEHWALLSASLAGLVFLFFTPLIELAPAALVWAASLAMLLRLSATINGFRGWSRRWAAGLGGDAGKISPVSVGAALALLVGVGMLVASVFNFAAGYHRGHADHMMQRTIYAEAIDAYKRAGKWYPADGDVPLNIALAASRSGRLQEFESFAERAVQMRPHDVRALTLLGRIKLTQPNRMPAARLGKRAVEAFPNSLEARNLLIGALDIQGHYEEAIEQAQALLDREPPRAHRAKLHMHIGDLYLDMLGQVANAKRHYEQALEFVDKPGQRSRLEEKVQKLQKVVEDRRRMQEGKPPLHMQPKGPKGRERHEGHGH